MKGPVVSYPELPGSVRVSPVVRALFVPERSHLPPTPDKDVLFPRLLVHTRRQR